MEWTLRLVGTEMDGQSRSFDVMEISRADGLGYIANLGDRDTLCQRLRHLEGRRRPKVVSATDERRQAIKKQPLQPNRGMVWLR
jgi:hypothetical protein